AGADELPRAARLELRRQDDGDAPPRADRAVLTRPRRGEPRNLRLPEARLAERRLPARAAPRRVRARPPSLPPRTGVRVAGGARPRERAARTGEAREALAVSRPRALLLRAGESRRR